MVGQNKDETFLLLHNQPHSLATGPAGIMTGFLSSVLSENFSTMNATDQKATYRLSPLCSNLILTSLCQK